MAEFDSTAQWLTAEDLCRVLQYPDGIACEKKSSAKWLKNELSLLGVEPTKIGRRLYYHREKTRYILLGVQDAERLAARAKDEQIAAKLKEYQSEKARHPRDRDWSKYKELKKQADKILAELENDDPRCLSMEDHIAWRREQAQRLAEKFDRTNGEGGAE